jgi:hypothetical protein
MRSKLLLLMRQRRGLSTGLSTAVMYVRRKANCAVGNGRVTAGYGLSTGLSTKIRCVLRKASGAAGSILSTTIKYLLRTRDVTAGSGLGTTISTCDKQLPPHL